MSTRHRNDEPDSRKFPKKLRLFADLLDLLLLSSPESVKNDGGWMHGLVLKELFESVLHESNMEALEGAWSSLEFHRLLYVDPRTNH